MGRSLAVVIGAGGGIGGALLDALVHRAGVDQVIGFRRPELDFHDEASIARAAWQLPEGDLRKVINAAGFLHDGAGQPEKSLRALDPGRLARSFAINAIGPALVMKHFLPRLPRQGRSLFASLSARVGSIGDNWLGGWYGYRASKAALNQLVRTAAIELARTHPEAVCVALHPGTIATALSPPFVRADQNALSPGAAAKHLLDVLDRLQAEDSGGFFDWRGEKVPW